MYTVRVSKLKNESMHNPSATDFSSRSILVKMQTIHVALKNFVPSAL